jgi:hypothetical protein
MDRPSGTYVTQGGAYKVLAGKSEGMKTLERTNVDGRIIFKKIFKKLDARVWAG